MIIVYCLVEISVYNDCISPSGRLVRNAKKINILNRTEFRNVIQSNKLNQCLHYQEKYDMRYFLERTLPGCVMGDHVLATIYRDSPSSLTVNSTTKKARRAWETRGQDSYAHNLRSILKLGRKFLTNYKPVFSCESKVARSKELARSETFSFLLNDQKNIWRQTVIGYMLTWRSSCKVSSFDLITRVSRRWVHLQEHNIAKMCG